MNRNSGRQWYCIELVDEGEELHSILSVYTHEQHATELVRIANVRLPDGVHIYYWRSKERPVTFPRDGYTEGPMARPDGPSQD